MLPVYRCADSYPHQRNQMPFTQYYHPGSEAVPPQMRMDPGKFPVSYESWPYGGNYGYPTPLHACCNHSYFPSYYNCPPPYPHFLPSLPFHCHGSYPTFPEAYPVQYVPPPHSSMEQPRYEFDKNVGGNYHCCGCPNHMGNRREDRSLKIEEQEPDAEKRGSNSLAPIELTNNPYPIVWFPPGYLKNKDHRKALESEVKDGDEIPRDIKAPESTESLEPRVWNDGWFPLDMNSIGSLKQGGDGKRTQSRQDGDKMGQFPLPIIWMPSHDKPEEVEKMDHRERNDSLKSAEELPSNFKVIPVKLPDSDDSTKKLRENEENYSDEVGVKMMEKNANRKGIPVKQMEAHEATKTVTGDSQGKIRGIPVKHVEDNNAMKKPSESSAKRQSSSPPKMSKLPPVCLRVDPLPRRKNGNGSSRSPSPSGHKGNSQEILNEKSKAPASTILKENTQQDSQALNCAASESKEVEPHKGRKVIEVTESTDGQNKDKNLKNGSQTEIQSETQIPVNLPIGSHDLGKYDGEEEKGVRAVEEAKKAADKALSGDGECKIVEDKRISEAKVEESEDAVEKRNLSDAEAAVIIQSAYRGFEVRKWEPLKKLKQIAKVREQVVEVRSQIHALESSSDLRSSDKQRMIIGETIMSLLLKLDTIQGLHPSIRDIRKSVARELTNLQEKLDSLTIHYSEELIQDVPTAKLVDRCVDPHGDVCTQGGQEKEAKEAGSGDNYSESGCDDSFALMEPHRCQQPHLADAVSGSQGEEALEMLMEDPVNGECKNKGAEVSRDEEPKVAEPEPITEPKDEFDNEKLEGSQRVTMEIQKPNFEFHSDSERKHFVELPLVINEGSAVPENEKDGMIELQKDEILVGGEDEQIDTGKIGVLNDGEVELNVGIDVASPYDKTPNMNQQEQNPQEVLEEGLLAAKLEDNVKVEAQNVLKLNLEAMQPQEENVSHDNELAEVSEAEEAQPVLSSVEKENHDEEQQEEAMQPQLEEDVSHDNELAVSAIEEAQSVFSQMEKEIHDEEQEEGQGIIIVEETKEENVTQPKAIGEKIEPMEEKVESKELEFDTAKDEALAGTQFVPTGSEQGEEKEELFPVSPMVSQFPVRENVTESDKKLIEENEKLREMMEKLIEAGKEQLTVISNLSGRVKDLERKLSSRKKKKLRTRRYRAATSASSCIQP